MVAAISQIAIASPLQRSKKKKGSTISELEGRINAIDSELSNLAEYSLRSGVGAIGYRSRTHDEPNHREWIQIELDSEYELDAIVLVPTIRRDSATGFMDDAFPQELRVILGSKSELDSTTSIGGLPDGKVIAAFDQSDHLSPRIAPLIVDCKGEKAAWFRVEAPLLGAREFDGKFVFQLSEVMAFSGSINVACGQTVNTSSDAPTGSPAWNSIFAVDGFVPFLMNGADEERKSLAFVSEVGIGNDPSISIDLEREFPISEIRIHLVDQGDTVPQTFAGDFGIPEQMLVEGATKADFSDARQLLNFRHVDYYDIGPIISRRVPETLCRYVRIIAKKPFHFAFEEHSGTRIGLSEIELISNGENVALGKNVSVEFESDDPRRKLSAITDGNNRYGRILPTYEWMQQLARRHDLETERPRVSLELNTKYQQQKLALNWLIGLAGLLAIGALLAVFAGWNMRDRAVQRTRERIAADLHDELGANFHAIGLLTDLVQESSGSPEKLRPLLHRIRDLTERTGIATKNCVNMLESVGLFDELEHDMRRASERIIADLKNEITFEGQEHLEQLSPAKRIDLFLFYKESLTNIIRHSAATRVTTHMHATPKELCLRVTDNGQGIQQTFINGVPPSLYRRARLLGADVRAIPIESGGTALELKLRLGKRWPMSMFASLSPKKERHE